MNIATMTFRLRASWVHSLKEKRSHHRPRQARRIFTSPYAFSGNSAGI